MESNRQLVPAGEAGESRKAHNWIARWVGAGRSARSVRGILSALQDAIIRAAAGAARTSARLGSVSGQIGRSNEALG